MSKRKLDDPDVVLSGSQRIAFAKIIAGDSVFVTGSAGTGKSHLIKAVTQRWNRDDHKYGLTATTGIAALNIGGRTLHSFMWLRVDDNDDEAAVILERLRKSPGLYKFYQNLMRKLKSLIIDEVSMLQPELLSKISEIFQIVRSSSLPFGGVQMILVGDFFQLPPVSTSKKFLFDSPIFKQAAPSTILLTDIHRQSDPAFIGLLGRMRVGSMTEEDHECLRSRVGADITKFDIMPTQLWSTNKDVDRINQDYLSQIKTPIHKFLRHIGIVSDASMESQKTQKEKFGRDIISSYPESIELKGPSEIDIGAQVMLVFNLDQNRGLVNGSRGVVTGFAAYPKGEIPHFNDYEDKSIMYPRDVLLPLVRFLVNGEPVIITVPYACIVRKSTLESSKCVLFAWVMPLKLAWASTVHKSQGQSLECVKISLDKSVFENGQAYVAVSRARTIEGITLSSYEPSVVRANEEVKTYYSTL